MGSVVAKLKTDLEARGDYVVMANISTGWFAVFPSTWRKHSETARRNGREGPNLVFYRTKSDEPRDHHVIPYSVARKLLVEDTLTHSKRDGSHRWNLTLKDGKLKVTHRAGKVDVSEYYGARLLVEEPEISISEEVVADGVLRDGAVPLVLASSASPTAKETQLLPSDLSEPPPRCAALVLRIIRDTKVARELKSLYGFACQVCGLQIKLTCDSFYIEVHHVRPLGGGHAGHDGDYNMLVLCPNHHAMFDYGIPHFISPQRIEIAGNAYDLTLKHGLSPESIAYHNDKLQRPNA